MKIKAKKPRKMLDRSTDSAKRAIKSYNEMESPFRIQNFIMLMNIAYLTLFQLYIYKKKGDVYYYRDKNKKFKKNKDGSKITWSLKDCLKEFEKYEKLDIGVKENIELFIGIRNKIEHTYVSEIELENILFGEIQSYVTNYNNLLKSLFSEDISKFLRLPLIIDIFNDDYSEVLKSSGNNIINYIKKYKETIPKDVIQSENFSFKIIALPNIVNKRTAPAITFMKENDLTEELKKAVVAEKKVIEMKETKNANLYKPHQILTKALEQFKNLKYTNDYNKNHAANILKYFCVYNKETKETDDKYCIYDDLNDVFVYKEKVLELLETLFQNISKDKLNEELRNNKYFQGRKHEDF